MRNHTLAAIITSTLLAAAATQAQPAPLDETPPTETKEMSTNTPASDGTPTSSATAEYDQGTQHSVTGAEAADAAKAKWTEADTDSSGTLSVSEMQAAMPTIASSFSLMDTNSDGQVSRDEMHSYKTQHGHSEWQKKFSTADINGDKMLDPAEATSLPTLSEKFASIDTDKDGKLSTEEVRSYHHAMGEDTREASKTLQQGSQDADEKRSTTSTTSTTTTTTTDDTGSADKSTTSDR